MQLLKLEVKNWVHHRHRVCEFTRGLVAILGENGSGKSSLFGAIRWALTGENPNYGVKADNVSQYAKEGEASFVTLEFEHNGHIAVATRHLLPEKEQSLLTIDGKEAGRGDKAVTAGIEKLLGVDAKFISRFIIVGQMDIFSFIDDNQADTDKFFQRLFNTAKADKCQDILGKNLAKVEVPQILQPASVLAGQADDLATELGDMTVQIDELPAVQEFLTTQQELQTIVNNWDARQQAERQLADLITQLADNRVKLDTASKLSAEHVADLAALRDASLGHEEAYAAARSALGHWESYKSVAKLKEKLQEQRAYLVTLRAKYVEPAPLDGPTSDEIRAQLADLNRVQKETVQFVTLFAAEGTAACPTCHTPSTKLAGHLKEQQDLLPKLTVQINELIDALSTRLAAELNHKQWANKVADIAAQEKRLDQSELELTTVPPPAAPEDELQQTVTGYEEFKQVEKALLPVSQQASEQVTKFKTVISCLQDNHAKLTAELAANTATEEAAELARQKMAELQTLVAKRAELVETRTRLTYVHRALEDQFKKAQEQEQRAVKLRSWSGIAEKAREALKNAPRLVAQRNLQKLEAAINELLQIFNVNFVVKVAEDGTPTFVAEFFDGRKQVAQRLSIGQKTVLALAFRVAVNALFAEEIGLLALDEPTAALDAPRIQALAPVLEKLRDLSTSKGLQCLLVTHASNLSHLFESVIELEAPELRHAVRAT